MSSGQGRFAEIPAHGLFTDEHRALREGVREYVERALAPNAEKREEAGEFPVREVFPEAGAVERGDGGFESGRVETVGWRTSQTSELRFDGVRLPADRLLGRRDRGFLHLMEGFVWERLTMALAAVAGAERTLQLGIDYAKERGPSGGRLPASRSGATGSPTSPPRSRPPAP